MPKVKRRRVVFLDRDGTIISDRPGFYLSRPEDMHVYRATPEALKVLRAAGYALVVVSNQSGIGRGLLNHSMLERIHAKLHRELRKKGARLDAIYFCPHHPDDKCRCRKPLPTLARRAIRDLGLTLKGAAVIGDKKADVDLATALKIPSVLVKTGHSRHQKGTFGGELRPTHQSKDVLGAARWIVKHLAAILLAAGLSARAASAAAISSATVQQPFDLVRGTVALPASHPDVTWLPPEVLEYEVKWGIMYVGNSTLNLREVVDFNGRPAFHIVSEAKSTPFCDRFYAVRDINESWLDVADMHSLGYSKKLREGQFFRDEWVLYDYPGKKFLSKTTNKDGQFTWNGGTIPGSVQDILSSMYLLRSKDLKVGTEVTLDVNTKQNWPLVIKVIRKKRVDVPAGSFNTLEVEPSLRDEGIFIQKGKRLQIWLTDDARRIPVRMSVEVFFGNVTASLSKIGK